jgi:hypothetical protein
MAGSAMIRVHHTGGLGDTSIKSYRVKSRQTRPLAGELALCDKLSPFRVLASPHRTKLLALKGYYIDENQVIRKNSNFAPMATVQEAPSSPPIEAPRTPAPINSVDGIASTCNTPTIAREEISMFESAAWLPPLPIALLLLATLLPFLRSRFLRLISSTWLLPLLIALLL